MSRETKCHLERSEVDWLLGPKQGQRKVSPMGPRLKDNHKGTHGGHPEEADLQQ